MRRARGCWAGGQLVGEDRDEDDVVDAEHDLERGERRERDRALCGENRLQFLAPLRWMLRPTSTRDGLVARPPVHGAPSLHASPGHGWGRPHASTAPPSRARVGSGPALSPSRRNRRLTRERAAGSDDRNEPRESELPPDCRRLADGSAIFGREARRARLAEPRASIMARTTGARATQRIREHARSGSGDMHEANPRFIAPNLFRLLLLVVAALGVLALSNPARRRGR